MIKELSPTELLDKLQEGKTDSIIDTVESATVEFKSQPYHLDILNQKHELAKDVSALANAGGGLIVLGVKTGKSEIHPSDIAKKLTPFPRQCAKVEQYEDIIRSWIYPPPQRISCHSFGDKKDSDKIFLAIEVPEQEFSRKPFLVVKSISDEKVNGTIFGMFKRWQTEASHLTVHEIQSLMRDGMLFQQILNGRVQLEEMATVPPESSSISEEKKARAAELSDVAGFADQPTFTLTACPEPLVDASRMFVSAQNQFVERLWHPPEIRPIGFDLDANQRPDIVRGEALRAFWSGRKALEFWRDGTLIFIAPGGKDFLAWGKHTNPYAINQVALVESTLLFCQLASELIKLSQEYPQRVQYSISLARMCTDEQLPLLRRGPLDHLGQSVDAERKAPACEVERHIRVPFSEEPTVAAYKLLAEFYSWFGFDHEAIPYVDRSGSQPAIDAQEIRAL